jgi:D-alanyl-D-alanine dipeptidase
MNPSQLTRQVADIYLAKELKPEPEKPEEPAVKLTAEQLANKTGIYVNPDGDIIRRIVLDGGILRSRGSAAGLGIELKPLSDARFKPAGQTAEFRFEPSGAKGMRLIETPAGGGKPAVFVRGEEFKPMPNQLAEYAGRYQSDEIEPVYTMAVHDGRLTLERLKLSPVPLEPAIKDLFANPPLGNIRFTRDSQGRVTGFILNRGRILNFRFKKIGPLTVDRQRPPLEFGVFRAPELVELTALDSSLRLDIRYATKNNFLGRTVYPEARAFLQRPAAEALVRVQRALKDQGYGLIVFDGYRPWAVTKLFWDSTAPEKRNFVADPAEGSKHNRGCAVDLSMVELATGREVAMPSPFDEMSERSAAAYAGGTPAQRERRDLLRRAMEKEGFEVYPDEWWHFDYKDWKQYGVLDVPFEGIAAPAMR